MERTGRSPANDAYAEEEERGRALAEIPLALGELVPLLERIAVALERIADRDAGNRDSTA